MNSPRENLAKLIDWITCPECGEVGTPTVASVTDLVGVVAVVPRFQCDTYGCTYSREGEQAWTLVSRG